MVDMYVRWGFGYVAKKNVLDWRIEVNYRGRMGFNVHFWATTRVLISTACRSSDGMQSNNHRSICRLMLGSWTKSEIKSAITIYPIRQLVSQLKDFVILSVVEIAHAHSRFATDYTYLT